MEVFTGTEKNKHSNSLILSKAGSVCAPAPQRMAKSRLTNWKKECSWAKNRCSKTHGKIACCPIYKWVRQGLFQKIWGFKTFSATVPLCNMLPSDEAVGKSIVSPLATGCLGSFRAGVMQAVNEPLEPLIVLKGFPIAFQKAQSTTMPRSAISHACHGPRGPELNQGHCPV